MNNIHRESVLTAELHILAERVQQLQAQRDELLGALEGVMYWDNGKPEWNDARAAIAKATGGEV